MIRAKTTLCLGVTAIVASLGLAACGSSGSSPAANSPSSPSGSNSSGGPAPAANIGNAAGTGAPFAQKVPLNPSTAKGGTLNVGSVADVDYLDPARSYYAFSWDIHQLINRTLLTYPDGDTSAALVPTGDIATGPATPTGGGKV
ncbi:MAG TPA: hypothetical protein VHV79_13705, partial [Mycobacteriales bacterium]|nr:hypothetical protein [Mycobacteriales bacterium]